MPKKSWNVEQEGNFFRDIPKALPTFPFSIFF